MRWFPIRWRLTLFHAITMAVIVIVLILAMFGIIGHLQDERLRTAVRDCAWIGESSLSTNGEFAPSGLGAGDCGTMTLAALDAEGRILAQFGYAGEPGAVYPGDVWRRVQQTRQPAQDRRESSGESGDIRFAYAIPVTIADPPARVIVASTSYDTIGDDTIFLVPVAIAGVVLVALIVIITASYFLVRSSLAPVVAITDAAREITASDLSRRLPVTSPRDELGRLSVTINDLLARLEAAFAERERALTEQRRFVADASHELRTPLTSILGYTRMLRQWGLGNPATAREGIAALEQEAERMHRLVDTLLRLARGDEDPALLTDEHDLGEVVAQAVASARAFADGPLAITVDVPDASIRAMVDRGMMVQVVAILLDNAVKYAGNETPIGVSLQPKGDHAVIRVTDYGPGIAPEHLPHLFDRFYRVETSRTTPGSGLGLAIARQIVVQHGGTIVVASTPGAGTTVTIRLPRLRDQSANAAIAPLSSRASAAPRDR